MSLIHPHHMSLIHPHMSLSYTAHPQQLPHSVGVGRSKMLKHYVLGTMESARRGSHHMRLAPEYVRMVMPYRAQRINAWNHPIRNAGDVEKCLDF